MSFLFNKINLPIIILSLLIPLTALLSHSIGYDEWVYYKTINYTQVDSILSLLEPHNNILGFKTPRYLLAYPIFVHVLSVIIITNLDYYQTILNQVLKSNKS